MAYDPRAIANLILEARKNLKCTETTQIVLQKLLYFCHGQYLISFRDPLISGFFEAWKRGPVHPAVYRAFKHYGREPITGYAVKRDLITRKIEPLLPPEDHHVVRHVYEVVAAMSKYTSGQLINHSHAEKGPWAHIVGQANDGVALGLRIPDNIIQERFRYHTCAVGSGANAEDETREDSRFATD